jgi:hypothetical protein
MALWPSRTKGAETVKLSLKIGAAALTIGMLLLPKQVRADLTTTQAPSNVWGLPKVALTIRSAWRGGVNLIFALYSSGRVLYVAPGDRSFDNYNTVTLTPAEQDALIGNLPLNRVGQLHPPQHIGADGATECIETWSGENARRNDCIWGRIEKDIDIPGYRKTPTEMVTIWKRLVHFSSTRAKPGLPDQVNGRAIPWKTESNCGTPSPWAWPLGWPHPARNSGTNQHGEVSAFNVSGTALPELRSIRSSRTPRGCVQPVQLDGSYYYLVYTVLLPHEALWNSAAPQQSRE